MRPTQPVRFGTSQPRLSGGGFKEMKDFVLRKIFPHNYDHYVPPYYTAEEFKLIGDVETSKKVRRDFEIESLSKKSEFHYYLRDPKISRHYYLFHVKPYAPIPEGTEPLLYRIDHQYKELYAALGANEEHEAFTTHCKVVDTNPDRIGSVSHRFIEPPLYTWTPEGPARFELKK